MFRQRKTDSIGVRKIAARQFKIYSIVADDKQAQPKTIEAAIGHVENHVEWPETDSGYGFITIHFGDSIWLLVDIWKDDILCHHLFRSDYSDPTNFLPGPNDGTTACVWELEVINQERDAWVQHVMAKPEMPGYEQYLTDYVSIQP